MTTPWPRMLRLAVVEFHIPPRDFWRLSLAEWRALTADDGPQPLGRAGLEALLRRFPD